MCSLLRLKKISFIKIRVRVRVKARVRVNTQLMTYNRLLQIPRIGNKYSRVRYR
jgi:hypothetical protein